MSKKPNTETPTNVVHCSLFGAAHRQKKQVADRIRAAAENAEKSDSNFFQTRSNMNKTGRSRQPLFSVPRVTQTQSNNTALNFPPKQKS